MEVTYEQDKKRKLYPARSVFITSIVQTIQRKKEKETSQQIVTLNYLSEKEKKNYPSAVRDEIIIECDSQRKKGES